MTSDRFARIFISRGNNNNKNNIKGHNFVCSDNQIYYTPETDIQWGIYRIVFRSNRSNLFLGNGACYWPPYKIYTQDVCHTDEASHGALYPKAIRSRTMARANYLAYLN